MPDDKAKFLNDPMLQDATLMRIQEAGEQLSRIRDNFPEYYEEHQTESWHRLIGLRNVNARGHVEIEMEEVWKTAQQDIPAFIQEIEALL